MQKTIKMNLELKFQVSGDEPKGALLAIEGLRSGNDAWIASIIQDIWLCNESDVDLKLRIKEIKGE